MNTQLVDRLKFFREGDLIERMELDEHLEPFCEKIVSRNTSSSPFFKKILSYMNSLTFSDPVDSFFHMMGVLLESIHSPKSQERKKKIKELSHDLNRLMSGENISFSVPKATEIKKQTTLVEYSFTEKDERELDYSALVVEASMLETYTNEVAEFLDSAQSALLDLEHDSDNEEAINRVFRCFHTIKSSSALLGYKNAEVLSHHMENMLGKVRDKELFVNPELIDVIFHGIGTIRDLMQVIEVSHYNKESMIKGFKSFVLTPYINVVERITKKSRNKKIGEILVEMGSLTNDSLKNILRKQKENNQVFGEVALKSKAVSEKEVQKALRTQSKDKEKQSYVRVSSSRLSTLIDMVGELVVNQSMIKEKLRMDDGSVAEQDVNQLEEITTSIKDMVLSMGMVPLNEMFQKLRVVVRNTARDLEKVISFNIIGEDTEMDRSLVEAIYDPLVHMIRNSVSHGIELPSEREEQGKPSVGQVDVTAEYRGNGVEISVKDDGRGIDPDKILDKAIKLGWIEPDQKEGYMQDKAFVYSLLYRPGFSIKDSADSISGRGVGMDVVMQNISRINGKVEIESEKGKGSTFRIKLPLTLAIIDGFVTEIMGEYYVFPFEMIEEILIHTEMKIIPTEGDTPMGQSRGKYLPIIDLYKLLTGENGEYCEDFVYVQIKYEDTEFVIPVNRVLGKFEIVIKNLNELIRHQKLFFGGTIFGDGSIGFILDIDEVTNQFKKNKEEKRASSPRKILTTEVN